MPHACQRFWNCDKTVTFCSSLTRRAIPCACHAKRHLNVQKWSEHVVCFAHFDFETCFAPQRLACFRHLNFQKWSDVGVFCTFWLRNVLRAKTACSFSSLIWPDGALATLLFDPPEPQISTNHWKNTVFRDFSTFSRACIFFPLTLSLLWSSFLWLFLFSSLPFLFSSLPLLFSSLLWPFPPLLFHLSMLPEVWLLNFFRQNASKWWPFSKTTHACTWQSVRSQHV